MSYNFKIKFDREEDGRWIAEVPSLPGVLVYGPTKAEAARALALRVLAIESSRMTRSRFSVSSRVDRVLAVIALLQRCRRGTT